MGIKLYKEDFVKKANIIHNSFYDYSKFIYVSAKTKGIIICPVHKEFTQTPDSHFHTIGCSKCSNTINGNKRKKLKEIFLKEVREKHNNFYTYDNFTYVESKTKSWITCPTHGDFLQAPCRHLMGSGCKKCATNTLANKRRLSNEDFLKKAKKVHGDKYNYPNLFYKNTDDKILIHCNNCNMDFEQSVSNHIYGKNGCPVCVSNALSKQRRITNENFLVKTKEIFGNKYTYNDLSFKNTDDKINIFCNLCQKEFKQIISCHIYGKSGCPICAAKTRGWSYSIWKNRSLSSNYFSGFKVYIIRCWDDNEEFYKIGKTYNSIKQRFKGKSMPYEYEIIKVFNDNAQVISELERTLQKNNKEFKYIPKIEFHGMYECYNQVNY